MAKSDAIIRNLEHVIDEKEREIEMLKDNLSSEAPLNDERVKTLEKKVADIEGLMKGLTEELLDLKAMVRKISRVQEEQMELPVKKKVPVGRNVAEPPHMPIRRNAHESSVNQNSVFHHTQDRRAPRAPVPLVKPELDPEEDGEKVLIMQPDGTLRPEIRKNERMIIAGKRPAQKTVKQPRRDERVKQSQNSKPLIYAEEDDTVEIKDN